MSEKQLFQEIVVKLRSLAESVEAAVNAMPEPDVSPAEPEQEETADVVEFERLFEVLKKLSEDGYRAEVKALLTKHGVQKLSALPKEQYAAALADAEAIRDGK